MNTNANFNFIPNFYELFDFYVEEYDDELDNVTATYQGEIIVEWLQAKGYTPEIYLDDEAGESTRNILINYYNEYIGGYNMNNNLNTNTNARYAAELIKTEEKKEFYFINFERLENHKVRSKWDKGVREYAFELLENLGDENPNGFENITELKKALLGGANSWHDYSWGGCSFIYNGDICERLATPSEQKRKKNGALNPNRSEEWLDVQARALFQAFLLIKRYTEKVRI